MGVVVVCVGGGACGHDILVEGDHVDEGEVSANVGVHNEKGFGIAGSDLVAKVVNGARGAERSVLLKISAREKWV